MIYHLTADLNAFSHGVDALERDFAAFKVRLAKAINSNPRDGEFANNGSPDNQ